MVKLPGRNGGLEEFSQKFYICQVASQGALTYHTFACWRRIYEKMA
jgi:hypothetical protein